MAHYGGYHQFEDEETGLQYGSFEVFWADSPEEMDEGWYWWACFPGCLPDGEASGPFATSTEAYNSAMEG